MIDEFTLNTMQTLLFNIFITFLFPGISIGGHLGGLAAGAACAVVMLAPDHRRFPEWATYATPIIVGVVSVVGSVLLVNSV